MTIWEQVELEVRQPQLLVYLRCSPAEELRRIRRRARRAEASITYEYLEELNQSVATEVAGLSGSARVICIDSERQDFASDEGTRAALVNALCFTT